MKFPNSLLEFYPCEQDETGNPSYYGFVNKDGNWYIMNKTDDGSLSSERYASGLSDFSTNWTGRAALTYGYPNENY